MTREQEVTVALADLDTATNALATRVQALIDQINNTAAEGLTGPQTEAVLTNLAALKTTLTGMGTSPTPLPNPPEPVPMPGPFARGVNPN